MLPHRYDIPIVRLRQSRRMPIIAATFGRDYRMGLLPELSLDEGFPWP